MALKQSPSFKIEVIHPSSWDGWQSKVRMNWIKGMKADFSNVYFHDKNGKVLDQYTEYYSESGWADIWVALPANDDYITFCWIFEESEIEVT